jgi:hypothetical protein
MEGECGNLQSKEAECLDCPLQPAFVDEPRRVKITPTVVLVVLHCENEAG